MTSIHVNPPLSATDMKSAALSSSDVLADIRHLKQYFPIRGGLLGRVVHHVKAVDDISFQIHSGETLSIVGESGCGKSTTGRSILRLDDPTSGEIYFQGKNILELNKAELKRMRKDMQIIFQDPFASLNPRQTVQQILKEALEIQKVVPRGKQDDRIRELMDNVGLRPEHIDRLPHEFSGGQRQRIGIARALALEPRLIICDEAVSALDVSIQAQIINLLKKLQKQHQLTYLFISHDLGVVRHISDRVIVMYLGTIVEIADKKSLFDRPQHPYTRALLSSIPSTKRNHPKERIQLTGDVPSPIHPPSGCRFHTRCPFAVDRCSSEVPELRTIHEGHQAACHLIS